jgi:elongation factor Tu
MNKCDMVDDEEMFEFVEMEIRESFHSMISMVIILLLSVVLLFGALNGVPEWEDKVMDFDGCS